MLSRMKRAYVFCFDPYLSGMASLPSHTVYMRSYAEQVFTPLWLLVSLCGLLLCLGGVYLLRVKKKSWRPKRTGIIGVLLGASFLLLPHLLYISGWTDFGFNPALALERDAKN